MVSHLPHNESLLLLRTLLAVSDARGREQKDEELGALHQDEGRAAHKQGEGAADDADLVLEGGEKKRV